MSKLIVAARPWVVFDAANEEHRKHYCVFVAAKSWSTCPVRFVVPQGTNNMLAMMEQDLAEFYVTKEFLALRKKIAKKAKRLVDSTAG
jgi:hypothetical protein